MNSLLETSPETGFQPRSRGLNLDVNEFGCLEDSSPLLDQIECLRERMQEHGYLYLKGFFQRSDVLAARDVVTDRMMAAGLLDDNYPAGDGVVKNIKIANSQSAFRPEGEVKTYRAEDFTGENQPLNDLIYGERMKEFYRAFFGGEVAHFNYTWFRAVSPGFGTPPHCDIVYMGRGTKNILTAWLPVGDAPLPVGGLMILEKSHQHATRMENYLSRDVDSYCLNRPTAKQIESGELLYDWDGSLSKDPVSLREKLGGRWLSANFEAGDLLIFTMATVHASLDNQSNRIRISADYRYQPADEPMDERFSIANAAPYRREFKKGRIC